MTKVRKLHKSMEDTEKSMCTRWFRNVLQVVPLGAYFSNRHHRLLAHRSGENAIATLALEQKTTRRLEV